MQEIVQRKNRILALFHDPAYVPMREKDIAVLMEVSSEERPLFKRCLEELLADGAIVVSKRGKYQLPEIRTLTGVFSASGHGYGFVHVDGMDEDFYISEKHTGTALHGDTVLIDPYEITYRRRRGGGKSREAVVVGIVERATDIVVGTYDAAKNHYGFFKV